MAPLSRFFVRYRDALGLGCLALVFFTGLRAPVLGALQRGLLATGFWRPALRPLAAGHRGVSVAAYPHNVPLYTLDGRPANLRRFAGKAVVLNLWASWCPPCRAEMPALQRVYNQVDTARVAFVMVSFDENPERARRVVRQAGYTFPVFFPAAPLPKVFDTRSIPTTFVLAPDGTVAVRTEGMADYDTPEFRDYLQQLAGE